MELMTEKELKEKIYSKDFEVRLALAKQGYGLHEFLSDEAAHIRAEVAKHGYRLDKLVNDRHWLVRAAIVKQGCYLENLSNDEEWRVRLEVAHQGCNLEVLANDENNIVKERAQHLLGSKTEVIHQDFGTYNGPLFLRIWEDKYEIESGCFATGSLKEWSIKCAEQIDQETSDLYTRKIEEIIKIEKEGLI